MKTSIFLLFASVAAFAPVLAQDTFGYTATSAVPFAYQNLAGTGVSVLSGADDGTATLTIPFPFRFYGISYGTVCASSNALLSFGSCVSGDYNNLDLTSQSPSGNQPLIAPFWSDLTFSAPGAGSLLYQTLGTAPNRLFVIQWNNATALNLPGTLDFQVILAETTNTITFQYLNVHSTSPTIHKGASATVGIRDASGHTNGRRIQWSFRAPVLSNNQAIRLTPPAATAPVEVTSNITAVSSAFALNRLTQLYTGSIKVTNTGAAAIPRPLAVVLANLPVGVTAVGTAGTAAGMGPYYLAPGTGVLAPGESVTVPVQFSNPANVRITFTTRVFSGAF